MSLLLEAPSHGIGVVGTESFGGKGFPMVYLHLFGPAGEATIQRDQLVALAGR
jgi:hypothetical protein